MNNIMQHSHTHFGDKAFTLIEMMIALAAGIAIVMVAFSGLRAASQSMTAFKRLSTENALLREAYSSAINEIDFWEMIDPPDIPSQQYARIIVPTTNGGGAFTPFTSSWQTPLPAPGSFNPNPSERTHRWNPSPMAWAPCDPRTWCRVNLIEMGIPYSSGVDNQLNFGSFALFDHLDPWTSRYTYSIIDPQYCRSWYANQVRGITDALGFYGLSDYLPSNVFYAYHGAPPRSDITLEYNQNPGNAINAALWLASPYRGVGTGEMPVCFIMEDSFVQTKNIKNNKPAGAGWLCARAGYKSGGDAKIGGQDQEQNMARGRFHATTLGNFCLPNIKNTYPSLQFDKWIPEFEKFTGAYDPYRQNYQFIVGAQNSSYLSNTLDECTSAFFSITGHGENLIPTKPSSWPEISVKVHRFIKESRNVNLCVIEILNPNTGLYTTVPFTCLGTTLRGARQQRSGSPTINNGWSIFHNPTPGTPTIGANLDN